MLLVKTVKQSQKEIAEQIKAWRLNKGITQAGLAKRSDVSLPSLRRFEHKGLISLESFLKLCQSLGCLDRILEATRLEEKKFSSIDDVLNDTKQKTPKRGWRE